MFRLILNGWDSLCKLKRMNRKDLIYLGVEDRTEQDKLLTAVSVLQDIRTTPAEWNSLGEESPDDRTLSRMDSGYYDIRDSESDELDCERLIRTLSFESLNLFPDYKYSSSDSSDNIKSESKGSKLLSKVGEPSKDPSEKLDVEPRLRARARVSESRLSIAEPNSHLNKSF